MRHLEQLPRTEDLAGKIGGDADFDPIRDAAVFVVFVEGLPRV